MLAAWLLLPLVAAAAGPAPREFPVAAAASQDDVYPERVTRFPAGVTGHADVTYAVLPGYRPLTLDLYVPAGDVPRPLVLFIHGGGWVGGNTRHSGALADFPAALASLAAEGFVVASVEYRLAAEAKYPAQLQDVRAALRFLRSSAARYRIDPARVVAWGGSAGGHLAALLATSCGDATLDVAPATPRSECVQGAVIWYGVFDFAPVVAAARGTNALLGCAGTCDAALVARASPVTYLTPDDPPFLLIHGEGDRVVDVAQSRLMEARLRAAGVPVRSLYIPAVDHSFIAADPAVTRRVTLEATNLTFDFFHGLFPARPRD